MGIRRRCIVGFLMAIFGLLIGVGVVPALAQDDAAPEQRQADVATTTPEPTVAPPTSTQPPPPVPTQPPPPVPTNPPPSPTNPPVVVETPEPTAVVDSEPPVITQPQNIVADADHATVTFTLPTASDTTDGAVAVTCDAVSGTTFPVGTTTVTCYARDAAGNDAVPVSFTITITAVPGTTEPPPSEPATVPATEPGTVPPTEPGATSVPSQTPTVVPQPSPTAEPTMVEPVHPPLELPWPPPGYFTIVTDGGPLLGLAAIWGYQDFHISQEFGHTAFSVEHFSWYDYGRGYGLDGYEHPGLDISMPAGTWLYSPISGTVTVSGNSSGYTFYGNGQSHVGQLRIETDDGNEVILGHMGRIAVDVGQRVEIGEFVGLSGGDNGDHLHLEVREMKDGWTQIVDPRKSFVVEVLAEAAKKPDVGSAGGTPVAGVPVVPVVPNDGAGAEAPPVTTDGGTAPPVTTGGGTAPEVTTTETAPVVSEAPAVSTLPLTEAPVLATVAITPDLSLATQTIAKTLLLEVTAERPPTELERSIISLTSNVIDIIERAPPAEPEPTRWKQPTAEP